VDRGEPLDQRPPPLRAARAAGERKARNSGCSARANPSTTHQATIRLASGLSRATRSCTSTRPAPRAARAPRASRRARASA
jgi:hypothetical protein